MLRLLVLAMGACVLALLWRVPHLLGWSENAALDWLAATQMGGPTLAATLSLTAAVRSSGRDRLAWGFISAGSLTYILANIAYIAAASEGQIAFPTPIDAAFFVMALLFAGGILLYGRGRFHSAAVDTYNFILLYGATIVGTLFLLHHEIKASRLSEFGTLVAFLYPALWCSIAALGAIVLALHPRDETRLPMALLTAAVAFEGGADFIYAVQLMNSAYSVGGWPHMLWMISAALIAWAAAEHCLIARSASTNPHTEIGERQRTWSQALAPAAILFVILITGSVSGAFGQGIYQYFSASLAAVLATVVGLREYWIVMTRNRLERIADERLLRLSDSEMRLTSVLESTSDSVLVLDAQWKVRFFNTQALSMIPELAEYGVGASFWDVLRPEERETYEAGYESVLETGEPLELETFNASRQMWIGLRAYSTGNGISVFFRDISDQKRIRDEIVQLAHHDFLTGLYSRVIFSRKLSEAIESGRMTAVLLIDLDSFKEINDTLGHGVGDAVLIEVAERLRSCTPEECLLARLGGDEFAIIIEVSAVSDVVDLGNLITQSFATPFRQSDQPLTVGVSIGISSTATVSSGSDLFAKADIALYEAKARRGGNVVVFEPAMEIRLRERKVLLEDLSRAVENNELELAYQPLLDTSSGRTVGFEALLRWRHPVRGLVSPIDFIGLAEESGLIEEIGEWALRAACAEAARWPSDLSISVNLSTRQLADEGLVNMIVSALLDTGLDHRRLELEVTESALLQETNLEVLKSIQNLGISLALDDFGTGYSSLSYLQRFQFDKLKIDRSFIIDVSENGKSKAIVSAVVELARILGMSVTAEGVETQAQFDWVAKYCDQVQGYFISRPMSASDAAAYLVDEDEGNRVLRRG